MRGWLGLLLVVVLVVVRLVETYNDRGEVSVYSGSWLEGQQYQLWLHGEWSIFSDFSTVIQWVRTK